MYTIYHPPSSLLPLYVKFLDQVASIIKGGITIQLEVLPIDHSHIIAFI